MHGAVVLASILALVAGACGDGAVDTVPASGSDARGEPIVVRTSVVIAAEAGAEVPATGDVAGGSTIGDGPFCVGGTIEDRHAGTVAAEEAFLLVRTITCPDGTIKIGFTPDVGQTRGATQGGSWTIVGGTGAFERLRGSGKMEVTYDPVAGSRADETWTGTVTR